MHFFVYKDQRFEWRWRLVAGNNRIIANSGEGYINKQDCVRILNMFAGDARVPIQFQH